MAFIKFYDSTELDIKQLTRALEDTDHYWEFTSEQIHADNIDSELEVVSVFVNSEVTAELIEALPKLKIIACRSTGFNNVDLAAAKKHGVTVLNVPTYGESTVAEYAFALLLSLKRKLPQTLGNKQASFASSDLRGSDLHGKTIGVIGTGHIGMRSIGIANGFEMNVIAYDPYPKEEMQEQLGFTYVPLEELFKQSDIITLHAPYTPETNHLIDAPALEKMKSSAVLVNTARGELIDNQALIDALNEGQIAGAAIDVIEGETLLRQKEELALLRREEIDESLLRHSVEISSLSRLPNVLITPHNSFNTVEAIDRINNTTAQNIVDFWYGHMPNAVPLPDDTSGTLYIVRHTESIWNASGQWTGARDVHLSEKGYHEAALLGLELKRMNIHIDEAVCSEQVRSLETLEGMLAAAHQIDVPIQRSAAINERDYGEYTGKNKWEMRDLLGEETWNRVRRGWNEPIPGGETLKDVYERTVPYFKETIIPKLQDGKNILLVAHGNSIRALVKYIESVSDEDIAKVEMLFGAILNYRVDQHGKATKKEIQKIQITPPNA